MRKPGTNLVFDVYASISKDPENDEKGVRRQVKRVTEHLERLGHTVGRVHIDNDTSRSRYSKKKRPAYDEMMRRIAAKETQGVAAYHWKRLIRRPRDGEDFLDVIEEAKAEVITLASGTLDLSTASGRGQARINFAFGAMESEEMSERRQEERLQAAQDGRPHGGRRPFGYNEDRRTLHPTEAPAFVRVLDWVIEGRSISEVARLLERDGFLDSNDNRFSTRTIHAWIHSERAIGNRVHKGEVLGLGDWTPLTTPDKRDAAIAALKSRGTHLRTSDRKARPPRLLSSLLKCECGAALRVRQSGGSAVYACDSTKRGKDEKSRGCGGVNVTAQYVEEEIEKRFLYRLTQRKTHAAFERLRRQAPDTSFVCDEIERLKMEMLADATDHKNDRMSRDVFMILLKGKQERVDQLTEELEAAGHAPATLALSPSELAQGWASMDLDERRRRLSHWIDSAIVLSSDTVKARDAARALERPDEEPRSRGVRRHGGTFDPGRVEVLWRV